MKTKLLLTITLLCCVFSYSQGEQCGTMKNLEEQIKKDPSIKERMLEIERKNQEWIEKNGRGFKKHSKVELNMNAKSSLNTSRSKTSLNTNGLCGYNNTFSTTITAPTTLNTIVSPFPNCTYGGEYVRVNNLTAGRTYRISTIGVDNFDTQITIYPAGGGNAVAFNDDWNDSFQSEIYFTPFVSGNYDILINQLGCLPDTVCASLEVELWYIPRPVITIPVVVHVMHDGTAIGVGKNISAAQIQSQIDILNEDFRRLNSDISTVPAVFRGASVDPLIQFCLAQQKPDGTPTNGILRYGDPSFTSFTEDEMNKIIKPKTIWDRNKYLNIWTIQFGGSDTGTLGYAPFPGEPASTDGAVISYNSFGRVGNLKAPYNLGRTTTHEIGHWLNLKHVWGDKGACAVDDLVDDTPLQTTSSSGCNLFPYTDTCSQNYPGIMFQNYMDYSNDNCLALFTYGQAARMDAALFNQRASLLTSPGCLPGSYKVVISQVYGGGGNAGGSSFTNDYIELFNRGTVAQDLTGWSVQYAAAAGTSWSVQPLATGTLQPGQYYLIQCAAGTTPSTSLPTADSLPVPPAVGLPISNSNGKVILVSNTTPETTANPTGSQIIDKVGYGTTPNGYEGAEPTGTLLSNTTAAFRKLNGCTDSDSNPNDFIVDKPNPRNSASTYYTCSSLSVDQNTLETVTLYPNPTNSKVFFDNTKSNFKEVAVYNYLGQEVARTNFITTSNNQEIDISNLAKGVYVLKLNNSEKSITLKIIKE